mmetsp:Transcript_27863/g.31840  ORF Transcript_27863/g.31840 Transcript_27863/m.31840 type:complete len:214 (-) Transcript_27863:682-1323(-)
MARCFHRPHGRSRSRSFPCGLSQNWSCRRLRAGKCHDRSRYHCTVTGGYHQARKSGHFRDFLCYDLRCLPLYSHQSVVHGTHDRCIGTRCPAWFVPRIEWCHHGWSDGHQSLSLGPCLRQTWHRNHHLDLRRNQFLCGIGQHPSHVCEGSQAHAANCTCLCQSAQGRRQRAGGKGPSRGMDPSGGSRPHQPGKDGFRALSTRAIRPFLRRRQG